MSKKKIRIPVYKPNLTGNEKKYLDECIETNWISSKGNYVNKFEDSFADYTEVKFASTVSNGTVALHVALLSLGIGPGDEVLVPSLTYIATVNAITYCGATPVFVDSEAESWLMDPQKIKNKITSKTKAILCVHLYGLACDMDEIMDLAATHNLYVIEDAAEAIGTTFKNKHVGTFGDIATFSFYGNKTITTGEGGMVITNDRTLHERVEHLKGQGLAKYREYWHDIIGYNYRLTNMQAAVGLAQLERVDDILSRKKRVANLYNSYLSTEFQNETISKQKFGDKYFHSYWMYCILISDDEKRDALRNILDEKGIETRPVFYPIHLMQMYSANFHKLPVAEKISRRGINLPSYPDLEESEIKLICNVIKNFIDSEL